jgi:hypothetical protein
MAEIGHQGGMELASTYSEAQVRAIAEAAAAAAIDRWVIMSKDQLANVALAAAKEASVETHAKLFAQLGVNVADFDAVVRFRDDLNFLGSMRAHTSRAGIRVMLSSITIILGAIGFAIWEGAKVLIKSNS